MKLKSLVRENHSLVPVDIEITLLPGLPTIQFLGLPDQIIKESIHRIKSAIRCQDFDFPRAQQVFVNIRPNHLKKSSRGLELAVAAGILWEMGQVPPPIPNENFYIYGELGLTGEVFEPEDLASDFDANEDVQVLTGELSSVACPFSRRVVSQLKNLSCPRLHPPEMRNITIKRPMDGTLFSFPKHQAEILMAAALGGHSVLLAGPSGSGKTTMAKSLASFLSAPSPDEVLEIKKLNKNILDEQGLWRPVINPHHSSTPLSIVGGGVPPRPGEITRAHRGLLILDELLEFHPKVQETLREPMEEGVLRLTRGTQVVKFPASAQVIATTNLCPCGDFLPGRQSSCRFSMMKCKSYSQRLSGPVVDRFEILHFTENRFNKDAETLSGAAILERLEKSWGWLRAEGRAGILNTRRPCADIESEVDRFYFEHLMNKNLGSQRRLRATLRVARSLADLDCEQRIARDHIERALEWTSMPFERLRRWD